MHKRWNVSALIPTLLFPTVGFAQHLSYGVVAGTALTQDFNAVSYSITTSFAPTLNETISSGSRTVIGGPTIEWNFSEQFGIEADAIYRELHFIDLLAGAHNPTVTWEFPIVATYRITRSRLVDLPLRPFIEAGPSFRATGNLNSNPSHLGVSAGAGFDVRFRRLNVSPEVRYTRWEKDSNPIRIDSRPDQLELLLGFTYFPRSDASLFGARLSVGAILGTNLLGDYYSTTGTAAIISTTSGVGLSNTSETYVISSGPRSFLIGPMLSLKLVRGLAIEVDAIHRPIQQKSTVSSTSFLSSGVSSFATWQFPVLAKYQVPMLLFDQKLAPFVEAGPAFRQGGGVSRGGVAAGGGVSMRARVLEFAPTLRYIRWQADPILGLRSNEFDFVLGVSF